MSLVGAFAASHAPGITGRPNQPPPEHSAAVLGGYAELRRRLEAARPDVLVVVSPEHWANFFLDHMPSFCIGLADEYWGPTDEEFVKIPRRAVRGQARLGARARRRHRRGRRPVHVRGAGVRPRGDGAAASSGHRPPGDPDHRELPRRAARAAPPLPRARRRAAPHGGALAGAGGDPRHGRAVSLAGDAGVRADRGRLRPALPRGVPRWPHRDLPALFAREGSRRRPDRGDTRSAPGSRWPAAPATVVARCWPIRPCRPGPPGAPSRRSSLARAVVARRRRARGTRGLCVWTVPPARASDRPPLMGPFGIGQAVGDSRTGASSGAGDGSTATSTCPARPTPSSSGRCTPTRAFGRSTRRRRSGLPVSSRSSPARTWPRPGSARRGRPCPRTRPDGSPMFAPVAPVLVRDRVRCVGDPVAFLVAESLAQAEDAAELVRIEYEPLPSVTATAEAARPGSPPVWDECPDNVSNVFETGERAATDAAFARADHVVRRRYVITRVHAQYMEPRGALGVYDPGEDRYTLHADVQYPHRVRSVLASAIFRVPEHRIRVVAGDIGGAFGTKGWQYPEHRLVLWAARKLGRPVRWACERREAILADEHARDTVSEAELALDARGRFLGLRVRTVANVGAYVSSDRNLLATFMNVATLVGVYTIPAAHVHVTCVLSNVNSTAPYRGAGRPESTYVIERLIDDAARELGRDRIELRRINLIPATAMPYRTALKVNLRQRALREEHGQGARAGRRGRVRRPGARHHAVKAGCEVWRSSTRSSGPPRLSPSSPRSGSTRAGAPPSSWAPRTRGRATRRRSSRCSTSGSASPRRGPVHRRRHRPGRLRHGDDGVPLHGRRRLGALARRRQGDRQGQADRRASAGSRRGGPRVRRRPVPGGGDRPGRHRHRGGARGLPAGSAYRRGSSRASTRRGPSCRSRTRGRTAATSARWRSTRTLASVTLVDVRGRRRRRHGRQSR